MCAHVYACMLLSSSGIEPLRLMGQMPEHVRFARHIVVQQGCRPLRACALRKHYRNSASVRLGQRVLQQQELVRLVHDLIKR